MSIAFGILALILAVLLTLSIRKNMKIFARLAEYEAQIARLKKDQEKLKTALKFSIDALEHGKAEALNLKIQNAKLQKDNDENSK